MKISCIVNLGCVLVGLTTFTLYGCNSGSGASPAGTGGQTVSSRGSQGSLDAVGSGGTVDTGGPTGSGGGTTGGTTGNGSRGSGGPPATPAGGRACHPRMAGGLAGTIALAQIGRFWSCAWG
jgi:hypothetical protein